MKPITVYGSDGPNPPKVALILAELDLPCDIVPTPLSEVKSDYYLALNPNGRLPTIVDPNTGIKLWESGAIIEYLIETYDKDRKISFEPGSAEYFHSKQWLFFQVSGQGPYYGQAAWFKKYHHEQLPSAVERYVKEIHRVTGVLEKCLEGKTWLVGEKFSYADLSFFMYQAVLTKMILGKEEFDEELYPNVKEWMNRMRKRASVQKVGKSLGREL